MRTPAVGPPRPPGPGTVPGPAGAGAGPRTWPVSSSSLANCSSRPWVFSWLNRSGYRRIAEPSSSPTFCNSGWALIRSTADGPRRWRSSSRSISGRVCVRILSEISFESIPISCRMPTVFTSSRTLDRPPRKLDSTASCRSFCSASGSEASTSATRAGMVDSPTRRTVSRRWCPAVSTYRPGCSGSG